MRSDLVKHSSAAVIRLNALDTFPSYVAVYSTSVINNAFIFSPAAMQWCDEVILNRLDCCESFWLSQLNKMQCDLETLFAEILSQCFGHDYIAVFGSHPWQCLMYLSYQRFQNCSGVYFLQNRLSKNIFQTLGWQFWFEPQSELVSHLDSMHIKGFNASKMHGFQERLRRFVDRVGLHGPFDIKKADYQSFSRRFGVWLAKLLSWTLNDTDDLMDFPWVPLRSIDQPAISRDLEYPVNVWDVVAGLLAEDLSKLALEHKGSDEEHINRINWQIRLFNEQVIEVDLNFRFPYALHRDLPDFKIALYQARYVYEDLMTKLQARDEDLDLPETMPLLGWRIEICERFILPPVIWDLFSDHSEEMADEAIVKLQHKLPVEIESYDYSRSFYPEQSFKKKPVNDRREKPGCDLQWLQQSLFRPLFYYPSIELIEQPRGGLMTFLERSISDWWQQKACHLINRDYYQFRNSGGQLSWVYRDFNGSWFKQGEYS
ncbi:MAG: hypothetical protein HKN34_08910 [Gammaproteobacteria bacterium]|nr:hypothetical protein [Gammaproteobacteria bacterium]